MSPNPTMPEPWQSLFELAKHLNPKIYYEALRQGSTSLVPVGTEALTRATDFVTCTY